MSLDADSPQQTEPPAPYQPSWVDRMFVRIEQLPIPALAFYGGLWALLAGIAHLVIWSDRSAPWGALDGRILLIALWTPYCLGLVAYLSRTAGRALDDFRQALDVSDHEFVRLRHEFAVLPARPVALANASGAVLCLVTLWTSPKIAAPLTRSSWLGAINVGIAVIGVACSLVLVYQTFRHLRLIRHTYQRASRLKLFQENQLYAFSALTLRIGIGWLVIVYTGVLVFPGLLTSPLWLGTAATLIASIAASLVATLSDIHQRISADKARQLDEVHRLLETVFSRLNQHVREGQTQEVSSLREAVTALDLERNVLLKAPTWPWQPGTMATFLTALSLPLLIWLLQKLIGRLMGL